MDDPLMSVDDVAKHLKLEPKTVRTWIADRKLKATRLGRKTIRIRRTDLESFLRSKESA